MLIDYPDDRFYCQSCIKRGELMELWAGDVCTPCQVRARLLQAERNFYFRKWRLAGLQAVAAVLKIKAAKSA